MSANLTAEERLSAKLEPFVFDPQAGRDHDGRLTIIRAGLPNLAAGREGVSAESLLGQLSEREAWMRKALAEYYARHLRDLSRANLNAVHSFAILYAHAGLIDALHRFVFEVALEELPALVFLRILQANKDLEFKRGLLPQKREKLEIFLGHMPQVLAEASNDAERDYYGKLEQTLRTDLADCERGVRELETSLPDLKAFPADADLVRRRLVLFARGGYGRAELSFGSDLDTGYCLDTRGLQAGQATVIKELILRMEALLNQAGVATVHQYFEIDEDLSRFAAPETLHTISAILEARVLIGSAPLLEELRSNFRALLPLEVFLKKKMDDFERAERPSLTSMDLKEDLGGLRSVQIPLWIMGVLTEAQGFMTVDLLRRARELGYLSLYEVARLLQALEFLYELRNFTGAAERFYYDDEARDSECEVDEFPANRINDQLARLYLFRKPRFNSVDRFDSYRLWLVDDVQKLSSSLLERVLDRTHAHNLGPCWVSVHLGRKRIIAIDSIRREEPLALRQRFKDGSALLTLFEYVAETDYDLTDELKDALAELVVALPAPGAQDLHRQAAQWQHLMGAPYAHRALGSLFAIRDPLAADPQTLIGRFLPDFNRMVFLLRSVQTIAMPLHQHMLRSVAFGQEGLEALRRHYPELHALIQPAHVRALKWSLLLHAGCALEGNQEDPARSAELAVELLNAIGIREPEQERLVRLLIEHHKTLVMLSKTASYMDQALAQYFEIAERDIVNVVLLYLVNEAVLRAGGERFSADVAALRHSFDEASRIFAELRGFPNQERALELINLYFDQRKEELRQETRLHLLLNKINAQGMAQGLLGPLKQSAPADWAKLEPWAGQLAAQHREIVLGTRQEGDRERLVNRFVQSLRQHLPERVLQLLTRDEQALFTWFFAAFPNRYLLGSVPQHLAGQMAKFSNFRAAPVLADVVAGGAGSGERLLVHTRNLERSHSRVAYALSRKRINIVLGKVNRVDYPDGAVGYCYFFQISPLPLGEALSPRELEILIESEVPPALGVPARASPYQRRGIRMEFLHDDGKGYRVEDVQGSFQRRGAPYGAVRITMRDQPFLYFKVSQVFDHFQVQVDQALITTTGNQVLDTFYLPLEHYQRLEEAAFEEFLTDRLQASMLDSVR